MLKKITLLSLIATILLSTVVQAVYANSETQLQISGDSDRGLKYRYTDLVVEGKVVNPPADNYKVSMTIDNNSYEKFSFDCSTEKPVVTGTDAKYDANFAKFEQYDDTIEISNIFKLDNGQYLINFKGSKGLQRYNSDWSEDTSYINKLDTEYYKIFQTPDNKIYAISEVRIKNNFKLYKFANNGEIASIVVIEDFDPNINKRVLSEANLSIAVGVNGEFYIASGSKVVIYRFTIEGKLDPTFVTGKGFNGQDIYEIQMKVQPDGKLLLSHNAKHYNETVVSSLFRLNNDGSIDNGFTFENTRNSRVNYFNLLADNKIIVSVEESNSYTYSSHINKLNPDGSNDQSFKKSNINNSSSEIFAIQTDGKFYVFSKNYDETGTDLEVWRIDKNGVIDSSFSKIHLRYEFDTASQIKFVDDKLVAFKDTSILVYNDSGKFIKEVELNTKGITGKITSLGVFSDGDILIEGDFSSILGKKYPSIARLNHDGTLDESFKPSINANQSISAYKITSNDKIIVYTRKNGDEQIIRLNSDGSIDRSFQQIILEKRTYIDNFFFGDDGKILLSLIYYGSERVVDSFEYEYPIIARKIVRYNSNGTPDSSFQTINLSKSGISDEQLMQTKDNKYIIYGDFFDFPGTKTSGIIRINNNGTIDQSFKAGNGTDDTVTKVVETDDHKYYVVGIFSNFDNKVTNSLIRLNYDGSLDSSFQSNIDLEYTNDSVIQPLSDGKLFFSHTFITKILNSDGSVFEDYSNRFLNGIQTHTINVDNQGNISFIYKDFENTWRVFTFNNKGEISHDYTKSDSIALTTKDNSNIDDIYWDPIKALTILPDRSILISTDSTEILDKNSSPIVKIYPLSSNYSNKSDTDESLYDYFTCKAFLTSELSNGAHIATITVADENTNYDSRVVKFDFINSSIPTSTPSELALKSILPGMILLGAMIFTAIYFTVLDRINQKRKDKKTKVAEKAKSAEKAKVTEKARIVIKDKTSREANSAKKTKFTEKAKNVKMVKVSKKTKNK